MLPQKILQLKVAGLFVTFCYHQTLRVYENLLENSDSDNGIAITIRKFQY